MLLLLLLFSLFAGIPPALSDLREYADCRHPLRLLCGVWKFNISYPFTAAGRPEYCGFGEKYRVRCVDDALVVEISGKNYLVSEINYETNVLSVVPKDSCPLLELVSLDLGSLFEYASSNLNVTLYNCSITERLQQQMFACLPFAESEFYLVLDDPLAESPAKDPSCNSMGSVPVRRGPVEVPNLDPFLWFDVRWKAGESWCRDCVDSGGVCGYNSSQPDAQFCYCKESSSLGRCTETKDKASSPCWIRHVRKPLSTPQPLSFDHSLFFF
ncbi:unnamed protein product [Spirodela intermedia]|uniref:Uncharacterized protein n=1 Tax=Spirodela intermedia TaxID=51605 RepID=A0A7I8KYJ2_SPIIN|nr:unnamed protein product [Spirodela intermedia]